MSKFLTYRNARLLYWIGVALFVASWFLPLHSWQEQITECLSISFSVIWMCAYFHEQGYNAGMTATMAQLNRDWAEQEPLPNLTKDMVTSEPFTAKTFREWEPVTEQEWLGNTQPASRAERKQQEQAYPGYSMLDEHHGQDAA